MTEYVFENPNKISFVTYAIIILLVIAFVAMIIYFFLWKIEPLPIKGDYAAVPARTGNSLYVCGSNSSSICSFQVQNLNEAINICDRYLNICRQFALTNNGIMTFVDGNNFTENPNSNIYIYQL